MKALIYGIGLQMRLDIRSKALLITCYVVPLLFFFMVGGIFVSIDPHYKATLIQSMTILGVSMTGLIGLPPTITEIYGSDIKRVYRANGVPMFYGLATTLISAFIHTMLMSVILYLLAPLVFGAELPKNPVQYFAVLALLVITSLAIGSVLGLSFKKQAKLTMVEQMLFLPSMMLSGIMFPTTMLPDFLGAVGKLFPATWAFIAMTEESAQISNLWPMAVILALAIALCTMLLKRLQKE